MDGGGGMPGWVWILLVVGVLLAFGWYYDRRRRIRDADAPASIGKRTPKQISDATWGEGEKYGAF